MKNRRAFLIVLDGVGEGADYGDAGANTLLHIAQECGPLELPQMERLGLGNILPLPGVDPRESAEAAFGKMAELSAGKDTTAGHWEISGVIQKQPLPTFPSGFPRSLLDRFEEAIGRSIIGNRAASGTMIINELGDQHVQSGSPIVYTSADSVFQLAAHEEVIPLAELYRFSEIAREMLTGEFGVARVIARPFVGSAGNYVRTKNRHDYSLPPPGRTVFEAIAEEGFPVLGIGKISDIYAGKGITRSVKTAGNREGVEELLRAMEGLEQGVAFVNLNDFDSLWGHRNDPESFARGLEEFDRNLISILDSRRPDDLLIITADHGNDPTMPGTDHSREYVPLLALGPGVGAGSSLGTRRTFADIAAALAHHLGLPFSGAGQAIQQE